MNGDAGNSASRSVHLLRRSGSALRSPPTSGCCWRTRRGPGLHLGGVRTHRLNTPSRRAIERLGAQLDGILRSHQRSPNGSLRDTAVYSITAAEWPAVKAHLDWQLAQPRK